MNPIGQVGGSDNTSKIFENGNLQVRNFQYFDATVMGTVGVTSGKWYYEATFETGNSGSGPAWGWCNSRFNIDAGLSYTVPSSATGGDTIHIYGVGDSGTVRVTSGVHNESNSNWADTSATGSSGQICGIAVDFDNSKAYFSINGSFTDVRSGQNPATAANPCLAPSGGLYTWNLTADNLNKYGPWYPAIGNWAAASRTVRVNFGQDSTFQGQVTAGGNADENGFGDFKYSVPAGFLAICTGNTPISSDIDPAQTDDNCPSKLMTTANWAGTAGSKTITGVGFKPDLTIIKSADQGNSDWCLFDTSRGAEKLLEPNTTANEETNSNSLTAFSTDGFTVGSDSRVNGNSYLMTAQCWKANGGTTSTNSEGNQDCTLQANAKAGFSIMTLANYTSASGCTLGHGLNTAPSFYIHKPLGNTKPWHVYHSSIGATKALILNTTAAEATAIGYFANTEPTADVLSLGNTFAGTGNGIVYAWSEIEGYSKFSSYVGNGNADGPYVSTSHMPRCVWIKRTDSSAEWAIYFWNDTTTNASYVSLKRNPLDSRLTFDAGSMNNGEPVDFLSNGFKIRDSDAILNSDGGTYIYCSWGSVPFKYNNAF